MIVGEAPGDKEVLLRVPFAGAAGYLLDQCLQEAGITRSQCFVTNVVREKPPLSDVSNWIAERVKDRTPQHTLIQGKFVLPPIKFGRELLWQEIEECKPTLVVAAGNLALWALTGLWGVRKWRSSILQGTSPAGHKFKVIPILHPAAILREYPLRNLLVHDLRRAKTELERGPVVVPPDYRFIIRPDYQTVLNWLDALKARLEEGGLIKLSGDIETRGGHTACLGIATSKTEALCIPFMCVERLEGYWTAEEETEIIWRLQPILTHPNASWTWQNGAYDHQYEYRWHFVLPGMGWDTMVAHHAMFSISPKALDYLSSLYCDYHKYWKEDGRNWDPSSMPEEQYWTYNCEDCVRTFEIREVEESAIEAMTPGWPALPSVVAFQHRIQPVITRMMLRGVKSNHVAQARLSLELMARVGELQQELEYMAGQELNINSPLQMKSFFYEILGLTPVTNRNPDGTRSVTCDDDALGIIAGRTPLLRPLIARIQGLRSAIKFRATIDMRRDYDGRLRCSYNVAGTKTYRLASSTNAFGSGGNLANISDGEGYDAAVSELVDLPNIRKLFVPDDGKTWFDLDGDSADLRVVTGESGCRQMQAYFAAGAKPYVEIAREYYHDPSITKKHTSYRYMKALCHGTNYGGEPAGLSARVGLLVHDVERIQKWYFGMCPEIRDWQEDIKKQIVDRGWVENPYGYRLFNWDRPSRKLLNEALAWTPQSTVGIWINKIAVLLDAEPWLELLLQVHDSLDGQYPSYMGDQAKGRIIELGNSVKIPCRTGTITVPTGLKTSQASWGECA